MDTTTRIMGSENDTDCIHGRDQQDICGACARIARREAVAESCIKEARERIASAAYAAWQGAEEEDKTTKRGTVVRAGAGRAAREGTDMTRAEQVAAHQAEVKKQFERAEAAYDVAVAEARAAYKAAEAGRDRAWSAAEQHGKLCVLCGSWDAAYFWVENGGCDLGRTLYRNYHAADEAVRDLPEAARS